MVTRVVVLGAGFGGLEVATVLSDSCGDGVEVAVVAAVRGRAATTRYDGRGICYLEFGGHQVAKVDVTFRAGRPPVGELVGPSTDLAADKVAFGAERIRRWFGREWTPAP